MTTTEILVALTGGGTEALGNIWRITAKKTDFYLDPHADDEVFHLSLHGPNDLSPGGHRFHLKVNRRVAATASDRGHFVVHNIPRRGYTFGGQELVPGAFLVARIRWRWDLQRARFRRAAISGPLPHISDNQSGKRLSWQLAPNEAADVDIVVSYDKPYWPNGGASLRDNARLGPLRNDVGMWLSATSFRRSQGAYPTPDSLNLPLPKPEEDPNLIMGAGPHRDRDHDVYWFVESITSRQFLERAQSNTEGT